MPGMGTGLSTNDPTIVTAFHAALLHQGLIVLGILLVVAVAWNVMRGLALRSARSGAPAAAVSNPEPAARRLLRIGFGLIWIFDGVLQGQASMPLGMTTQVIQPAAASSPSWVQHIVNAGATIWSYHPVSAPAAAVWIQIGLGVWLLAAPRGNWSRLAGVASAGWGIIVWVFGEAFGGIFAAGLTWLFGAPGAVLFYSLAGILIALPDRNWTSARLGRMILGTMGLFFTGMAVLQAWPGRGFWQGTSPHSSSPGTLTSMVQQMAQTPQPGFLSDWIAAFGRVDAAHAWTVNLFCVVALFAVGATFLCYRRPRVVRVGMFAGIVLCLADWVLIEDLGFFGGVGTDPNSMVPMTLVFVAGYLAVTRMPSPVPVEARAGEAGEPGDWRRRLEANPSYVFRSIAAVGAIGIALVGAAPMAVAATRSHADPILSEAVDGPPTITDIAAPDFTLTDQSGTAVTLSALRGKTVALTFLDPVCISDCPVIADEFIQADRMIGSDARHVDFIAIDANPRYTSVAYLQAFDLQDGLEHYSNWLYLTGSLPQLEAVWRDYGVYVGLEPAGAMVDHSDLAYVIDATGHTRLAFNTDPGPATSATTSSFSATLANAVKNP